MNIMEEISTSGGKGSNQPQREMINVSQNQRIQDDSDEENDKDSGSPCNDTFEDSQFQKKKNDY